MRLLHSQYDALHNGIYDNLVVNIPFAIHKRFRKLSPVKFVTVYSFAMIQNVMCTLVSTINLTRSLYSFEQTRARASTDSQSMAMKQLLELEIYKALLKYEEDRIGFTRVTSLVC